MSDLQEFRKRHYFQHEDTRKYMGKWNGIKKKRMWGIRIDPDFNKFHYLVWNYMLVHINTMLINRVGCNGFTLPELEMLVSLVHENRAITVQDMVEFPSGLSKYKIKILVKRYINWGILEKFEGHASKHNRQISYRISKMARSWVSDINMMQLGYMKIPLSPSASSSDFVKRESERTGRNKHNWYGNILKFNSWVDDNKKKITADQNNEEYGKK